MLLSDNAAADDNVTVVDDYRLPGGYGALGRVKRHVQGVRARLRDGCRGRGVLIAYLDLCAHGCVQLFHGNEIDAVGIQLRGEKRLVFTKRDRIVGRVFAFDVHRLAKGYAQPLALSHRVADDARMLSEHLAVLVHEIARGVGRPVVFVMNAA